MQSIGEQLEDARKRKGISLREAAEATKIRSDFLGFFEQNKFDYDLPELYKRGFLKNYARYLKLDPDKILTNYNAQLLGNTRTNKRGASELFGQIEIKKTESQAPQAEDENVGYGRIAAKPKPAPDPSAADDSQEAEPDDDNEKIFYLKIGLVFAGTLALVFIVFGLIKAILSSSGDDIESTEPPVIEQAADSNNAAAGPVTSTDDITLIASGTVYVLVKQQSDNAILFRDTMSEGQTVALKKKGPIDILFTAGENIVIEQAGERMRPDSSGTAKITLP